MRIAAIFNPVARGDKARRFQSHLDAIAREAALKPTTCAGDARRLAAEAVHDGFEAVVAAGGDGTVNEVLNGIADADGFARTVLGVLPLGTTNVFAKELRLPHRFAEAWAVIQRGKTVNIDLPRASFTQDGQPQRRYFAQMAGAGLDSRAIELVSWRWKKRIGYLAYVVSALHALAGDLPLVEVSDGERIARGELVLIGNGKFYGGRFNMFPLADMRDGVLEAVVYPRVNLAAIARSSWGMVSGNFHTGARTIQLRGERLELKCEQQIPFHLEGENVAPLPVSFEVEPQALRVLVP